MPPGVVIVREEANLPPVRCRPAQINQLVLALLTNATQAMEGKAGQITVRTGLADSTQAWFEIADQGCGIPPENLPKLFEPLFTTKIKGIGLGLAVSKKLIEANGGRIEVKSEAGVGSTFTIWMPVK